MRFWIELSAWVRDYTLCGWVVRVVSITRADLMVSITLRRVHVMGHESIVTVMFVDANKAFETIARWDTDRWRYIVLSVCRGEAPKNSFVACDGQVITM